MTRFVSVVLCALVVAVSANACARDPQRASAVYIDSGNKFFEQQKYNEAIVEYRNAIAQDPRSGEARLRLADAYEQLGDRQSAFGELVRAADLMPDNADVQVRAGRWMLMAGQFEDAKQRAERVLAKAPKHVAAQLLLANALAGLKDMDAAVQEVKDAIQLDPTETRTYTNLGVLELKRGKNADAEAAFKRAVAIAPRDPSTHVALANFYWATGQREPAERELKTAADLDPENADVNQAVGTFLLGTQRVKEAEPYLLKAAKTGEPQRRLLLADYYTLAERLNEAERILIEVAADPLWRPLAHTKLASIRTMQGRESDAEALLTAVLNDQPTNPEALLNRARLRTKARRFDEALADATAALAGDPSSIQAHYLVGVIQGARGEYEAAVAAYNEVLKNNPRAAIAQVQLARLNLATGRPDSSLQFAQQAVASAPRNLDARLVFVRALVAKGDLARAGKEVALLTRTVPDFAAVQEVAGVYHLANRDSKAARAAFERALKLDPSSIPGLRGLTRVDLGEGRVQEAVARVEAAAKRQPQDPQVLAAAADAYLAIRQYDKAEKVLQQQLAVAPNALEVYDKLGRIYIAQSRLEPARQQFETLAKRSSRSTGPATMAAMILQLQNKPAEAKARYQQIVQLDPEAAVAANNLAMFHILDGDSLDVALHLAQTATSKQPDNPAFNDTLGWIYYKKGLYDLAIPPLRIGVEKAPDAAEHHYHLGMAYEANGDYQLARTSLARALELNPKLPEAADARRVLAAIDQRIGNP